MRHSIIPLFIPHCGCPHQCIFCNQVRITGRATPVTGNDVRDTVKQYISSSAGERIWEAAFYGGTFTALPADIMEELLQPASDALKRGEISSIRLSTRPDCITEDILDFLKKRGVSTIELGVQSLDSSVLEKARRGHTAEDVVHAVSLIRKHRFALGLQFMPGLPGENMASLRRTARMGARLQPDFVRLYPVLVIEGTPMADMYRGGAYTPLTLDQAVFVCAFLRRWYLRHGIRIIRTGLQATEELDRGSSLLAGPYHPAMGELTEQYIYRHVILKGIRDMGKTPLRLFCCRKDMSKVRGKKKKNWESYLRACGASMECREDDTLVPGRIRIDIPGESRIFSVT